MTNKTSMNQESANKTWIRLFIWILGLQAILELVVGGTLLFNFPVALEDGFGISYSSELDVLGIALGLYLLLLTTLMVFSIIWTTRQNYSGISLGIIIGIFLLVFGLVSSLRFGDMQAIMVDGLRGLLTIFLAYKAGKQLLK